MRLFQVPISLMSISILSASISFGAEAGRSEWIEVPQSEAQCTPGARSEGHHAKVRISMFQKDASFRVESLPKPQVDAVKSAINSYPKARYIGNGPIFLQNGKPNGYLKSDGKTLSPIDCKRYRLSRQNLGKENSIFVRYRLGSHLADHEKDSWQYKVISADSLCAKRQTTGFKSKEVTTDLPDENDIDFALQSGPGVLRDGQNLLEGYNSATRFRSYIGVTNDGRPVVVEADGNIGSFCLGEYLKKQGLRDLLHRDSSICDAAYRESNGSISGYPTTNPAAIAASLLIISNHP